MYKHITQVKSSYIRHTGVRTEIKNMVNRNVSLIGELPDKRDKVKLQRQQIHKDKAHELETKQRVIKELA